ncbi:hypothetical protein QTP88_011054 [Uroleucon formosanum]
MLSITSKIFTKYSLYIIKTKYVASFREVLLLLYLDSDHARTVDIGLAGFAYREFNYYFEHIVFSHRLFTLALMAFHIKYYYDSPPLPLRHPLNQSDIADNEDVESVNRFDV